MEGIKDLRRKEANKRGRKGDRDASCVLPYCPSTTQGELSDSNEITAEMLFVQLGK